MKNHKKSRNFFKSLLLIVVFTTAPSLLYAVTATDNVLSQSLGARPLGMGEAFTAVSDDVNALLWNPAGLSTIKKAEASTMFNQGIAGSGNTFFGFVKPDKRYNSAIGVSIFIMDGGSFEYNSPMGITKNYKAQMDYLTSVSYSKKVRDFDDWALRAGVNGKFLVSTLVEQYSSDSFTADLGLMFQNKKGVNLGLLMQNYGGGLKYLTVSESLPSAIRVGASYTGGDFFNGYTTSIESVSGTSASGFHAGVEYVYAKLISVRVGFKSGYDLGALTYGVGFNIKGYQLDYAVNSMGELGNTNKISLIMRLK